jgi:hypothetical protein
MTRITASLQHEPIRFYKASTLQDNLYTKCKPVFLFKGPCLGSGGSLSSAHHVDPVSIPGSDHVRFVVKCDRLFPPALRLSVSFYHCSILLLHLNTNLIRRTSGRKPDTAKNCSSVYREELKKKILYSTHKNMCDLERVLIPLYPVKPWVEKNTV